MAIHTIPTTVVVIPIAGFQTNLNPPTECTQANWCDINGLPSAVPSLTALLSRLLTKRL